MISQIFTVYDSKAEAYMSPFFMGTKGEAIRSFSDTCQDTEHQFNRHSADFTLFHLGWYDNNKAFFEILETPNAIGMAIEFINPSSSEG